MKHMRNRTLIIPSLFMLILVIACKKETASSPDANTGGSGMKIAYVNGDSILMKYDQFSKLSDVMKGRQQKAEEELQRKLLALEKEFVTFQQKAQSGTMTPKEIEAREKYFGSKQETLMRERDEMAKTILDETAAINKQLKSILDEKLDVIKTRDGYDFILNYVEGGAILSANPQYDLTEEVLRMLNEDGDTINTDTTNR
jgi:outer membrane protein